MTSHKQLKSNLQNTRREAAYLNHGMHANSGLACGFFCLQDYRPGSVITAVLLLAVMA